MSVDGILVLDKPPGRTSRWATNKVSRLLRQKKAGHLGTLDPNATGVLPVVLGKATRLIKFIEGEDKQYRGVVRLGVATDSQDAAGEVIAEKDPSGVTEDAVREALRAFEGEIEQVPPMHSAVKKDGKPLYKLARQGVTVEREPRRVTVHEIDLLSFNPPDLEIGVTCSPGTYLRTIAHDLGQALGVGAHLHSLVRTRSGAFRIEDALSLDGLGQEAALAALIPLSRCLPSFPEIRIDRAQAGLVMDGVPLLIDEDGPEVHPGLRYRLLYGERLAAVASAALHNETIVLKPERVFPIAP